MRPRQIVVTTSVAFALAFGSIATGVVMSDALAQDAIEQATGHRPASNEDWNITAVKATTDQASLLGISVGDPLLRTPRRQELPHFEPEDFSLED